MPWFRTRAEEEAYERGMKDGDWGRHYDYNCSPYPSHDTPCAAYKQGYEDGEREREARYAEERRQEEAMMRHHEELQRQQQAEEEAYYESLQYQQQYPEPEQQPNQQPEPPEIDDDLPF